MVFLRAGVGRVDRVGVGSGGMVVVVGGVGGVGGGGGGGSGVSAGVGAGKDVVAVALCGVAEAFVLDGKVGVRNVGGVEGGGPFYEALWEDFVEDGAVLLQDLFGGLFYDFPAAGAGTK